MTLSERILKVFLLFGSPIGCLIAIFYVARKEEIRYILELMCSIQSRISLGVFDPIQRIAGVLLSHHIGVEEVEVFVLSYVEFV